MHKLKSREYLDKINETFGQLSDPAHEIDIDTLLGYIRVFYSSVKSIPVKAGSSPAGNTIAERSGPTADISAIPATGDETNKPDTGEESGIDRTVEEPSSHMPAPTADLTEKDTSPSPAETEEMPVNEQIPVPEIKTGTEEPTTSPALDAPAEIPEKATAGTADEDVLGAEPEPVPEEAESTPFEEIKTVVPSADENEIKNHQAAAHINEPAPRPEVIQQPVIPTSQVTESAHNILSRIESQQNKPLYTATSEKHYDASDAVEAIFRDKSPTGLVDFLGLSPLDNLGKAWGLNEKMLVIKDLFDNDSGSFNDAVEMINKLSTFEEAKAYLINNVVQKFAWNDVARFKKASDFVVQVKRLFVK